jgi:hypothetical protein
MKNEGASFKAIANIEVDPLVNLNRRDGKFTTISD